MLTQAPESIMMIRPSHFGYNPETAGSNAFQKTRNIHSENEIISLAQNEFDHFVDLLARTNINIIVFKDREDLHLYDSVFPNNWLSFHHDGTIVLYPMMSGIRRMERRMDIVLSLQNDYHFQIERIIDYTEYENHGRYLEGTGSVVFNYSNKIAYANRSPRTDEGIFDKLCSDLGFQKIIFNATDLAGQDIYHTNVLMCIGTGYVIVCLDALPDESTRKLLLDSFEETGHEVIDISYEQLGKFAGNMIEVRDVNRQPVLVMSEQARKSLKPNQVKRLSHHAEFLSARIPVIERYGGGSVRCMIAGIFLPKY